jgi:hypothetical protein
MNLAQLKDELAQSCESLIPLADHVQASYVAARTKEERSAAFLKAKSYAAQSLASVAFQVNEAASALDQMLGSQEQEISSLSALMQLPRQVILECSAMC